MDMDESRFSHARQTTERAPSDATPGRLYRRVLEACVVADKLAASGYHRGGKDRWTAKVWYDQACEQPAHLASRNDLCSIW